MVADTQMVPFERYGNGVSTVVLDGRLTDEQMSLVSSHIMKGANATELSYFRALCARLGLSPFSLGQIFAYRFRPTDPWIFHVGLNGLRLIAERTGEYQGRIGPEWCAIPKEGQEVIWRKEWLYDQAPAAARVAVCRRGFSQPLWATATWREFGKPRASIPIWQEKPAHMLAKAAEMHALRAGFPAEMAELVLDTEYGEEPRGGRRRHTAGLYPDILEPVSASAAIVADEPPQAPPHEPDRPAARPPMGNAENAGERQARQRLFSLMKAKEIPGTIALQVELGLGTQEGAIKSWADAYGWEALCELLQAGKTVIDFAADNAPRDEPFAAEDGQGTLIDPEPVRGDPVDGRRGHR